ncbi:aldo/keto reductase [Paracoccus homiensis]|uniref:Aldo/keto reductase family protein n=1 Tax=Paracoccus homiensis TaxID=364199 RepID=A0A1I0JNI6_9RHOB|nr:aldo/keto reductase [Paracoccus homiensis]SEU11327.1 Aldo/keto reductase family protein [Paracoccus homiensis]
MSAARTAQMRGATPAQVAQAWALQKSEMSSMQVGGDSKDRIDSALSALRIRLDQDELFEIERNHTPCDPINDYTTGKRI